MKVAQSTIGIRPGSFTFAKKWAETVKALPETGMGYSVVSVTLQDGRKFDQAVIDSGRLSRIRGLCDVPFNEEQIIDITATHQKWDWDETE